MTEPTRSSRRPVRRATLLVSFACAVPIIVLGVRAFTGRLSPNPIEDVTHVTGEFALRFLLVTFAITPLRRLTGWAALAPQRRTFGLAAFSYATLHMLTWAVLDQGLHGPSIAEDLLERPYIWLGATAFVTMTPLAATSTRASMRRLGRRWQTLHKATYLVLVLALAHYFWLVKSDESGPLAHAAVAAVLLGLRFWPRRTQRPGPNVSSPSRG